MSTTQQPFTLWTKPASNGIRPALCSEAGMIFGIRDYSDIMFRQDGNLLYAHTAKGTTRDAAAIMERRGN